MLNITFIPSKQSSGMIIGSTSNAVDVPRIGDHLRDSYGKVWEIYDVEWQLQHGSLHQEVHVFIKR